MKIAFCIDSLNKGGAERVVCNLANFFAGRGDDVCIIVTTLNKKEYRLCKRVKVFSLGEIGHGKIYKNYIRLKRIRKILLNFDPDVAFAFLQKSTFRLLFLKTFCVTVKKIPVIVSVRCNPESIFSHKVAGLSLPFYNMANGFVFQTEEAKRFFNRYIQDRSIVIANPVNPSFFSSTVLSSAKRDRRIVAVGRLDKQKNYPMLIDAFSDIVDKYPEYILEIYGDGPIKSELWEYIKGLRLDDRVILRGKVDDIKEKIESAALFVMTSNYEGMSNALMEALALGLPCISTDSAGGGAASLIRDGINGFLIPINDVVALKQRMDNILSDNELSDSLSREAIESMRSYNPDLINAMWLRYTEKIIEDQQYKRRGWGKND